MKKHIILLFMVMVIFHHLNAQTKAPITETVQVGKSGVTELLFSSDIIRAKILNDDYSYKMETPRGRSIRITADKKTDQPQSLIVEEGNAVYKINLVYKEDAPPIRVNIPSESNAEKKVVQESQVSQVSQTSNDTAAQAPAPSAAKTEPKPVKTKDTLRTERSIKVETVSSSDVDHLISKDSLGLAISKLEQLIQKQPANIQLKVKLQELQTRVAFRSIDSDKDPEKRLARYKIFAKEKSDDHEFTAARLALEEALKIKPNDAMLKTQLEKVTESEKADIKLQAQKAQYALAIQIADRAYASGDLDKAIAEYERSTRIFKDSAYPKNQLAFIKPKWDAMMIVYDSLRKTADSLFSQAKQYENAIELYKQMGRIRPGDKYSKNQIKAVETERDIVWKSTEPKRYSDAFEKAKTALEEKKYREALTALEEMERMRPGSAWALDKIANVKRILKERNSSQNTGATAVTPPVEKDSVHQLPPSLPEKPKTGDPKTDTIQNTVLPPQVITITDNKPASDVSTTKATVKQDTEIPYNPTELNSKYPGIDFSKAPADQSLNLLEDPSIHATSIRQILSKPSESNLKGSNSTTALTLERIDFIGANAFIRLLVQNHGTEDLLVGPMMLNWQKNLGSLVPLRPVAVSAFPIVQPGKEIAIVYVCRHYDIDGDEKLYFEFTDRLHKNQLQLVIDGKFYNEEKSK